MTKRPAIDLSSLTSESAAPMAEASQRTAIVPPSPAAAAPPAVDRAPVPTNARAPRAAPAAAASRPPARTKTENLQPLAFKVPPAFRKRFRQHAANADLKLNELLFAALEAWEEKHKL